MTPILGSKKQSGKRAMEELEKRYVGQVSSYRKEEATGAFVRTLRSYP